MRATRGRSFTFRENIMPRVKPAVITLRDGTILRDNVDKIDYGAQLLTTYADELQSTPTKRVYKGIKKLLKWNTTEMIQEMKQVRVPIKSWPYSAIKDVDWGYMPKKQYDHVMSELAKAKQAADAKQKGDENGLGNSKDTTVGAK